MPKQTTMRRSARNNVVPIRTGGDVPSNNRPEDHRAIEHRQLVLKFGKEHRPDILHQVDEILAEIGQLPRFKLRCLSGGKSQESVMIMYFRAKVAMAEFEAVEAQATIAIHLDEYSRDEAGWRQRRDDAARKKNLAVEACIRTPASKHWHNRQYKASLIKDAAPFGEAEYWRELLTADEARLADVKRKRKPVQQAGS